MISISLLNLSVFSVFACGSLSVEVKPQYILMHTLLRSALLTICYKAELSAPVTIFSCWRAGGKRCSGKVCTAERKREIEAERMQMRIQIETTAQRCVEQERGNRERNVEMEILLSCRF